VNRQLRLRSILFKEEKVGMGPGCEGTSQVVISKNNNEKEVICALPRFRFARRPVRALKNSPDTRVRTVSSNNGEKACEYQIRAQRTTLRSCMICMIRAVSASVSRKRGSATQSTSRVIIVEAVMTICMAQTDRKEGSVRRVSGGKIASKR